MFFSLLFTYRTGWIVCGVAFLAHVLTTGFQLSYGLLYLFATRHLGQDVIIETGKILFCDIVLFFCFFVFEVYFKFNTVRVKNEYIKKQSVYDKLLKLHSCYCSYNFTIEKIINTFIVLCAYYLVYISVCFYCCFTSCHFGIVLAYCFIWNVTH